MEASSETITILRIGLPPAFELLSISMSRTMLSCIREYRASLILRYTLSHPRDAAGAKSGPL